MRDANGFSGWPEALSTGFSMYSKCAMVGDTDGVAALKAPHEAPPMLLSSCILNVVLHMSCNEKPRYL